MPAAPRWLSFLLPRACLACGECLGPGIEEPLCRSCAAGMLPVPEERCCPRCGVVLPAPPHPLSPRCPACAELPDTFNRAASAFQYRGTAGRLLRSLKYRRDSAAAVFLAREALPAARRFALLADPAPTIAVPVPLHPWREFRRGYNQAAELSTRLAEGLALEHEPYALNRAFTWRPQVRRRTPEERLQRIRGAFRPHLPGRVAGRAVLLVDDVMTTGATVAWAASALRGAGASAVWIFTIARAGAAAPKGALPLPPAPPA
ncbi:MAG: ComF family protein [Candidatus Sumerlaeia bacterium]|nr:ComF family protein [Candidatus Sumerlaeia bacterium]